MALVCSTQSMSMFISISMLKNSPFPSSVQSILKGAAGAAPFIGCEAGVAGSVCKAAVWGLAVWLVALSSVCGHKPDCLITSLITSQ